LFLEADKISRETEDLDVLAEEVADLAAKIAAIQKDVDDDDDEDENDEDEDLDDDDENEDVEDEDDEDDEDEWIPINEGLPALGDDE
jgi:hypothetical protein